MKSSDDTPSSDPVTFTWAGISEGARKVMPLAVAVFSYGLVFGVLTRRVGLSVVEAALMSAIVFAGSSQFVALGLWTTPLPIVPIVLTTFVVNLRMALMGAALGPTLLKLPRFKAYGSLFLMADENWALTMAEVRRGSHNGAFLMGSGIVIYLAWLSATVIGRTLGNLLHDPSRFGLDFAFTAVFISLLVSLWRGRVDVMPWLVAAVVALAASHLLPGKWYIVLGAIVGSTVGALRVAD